MGMTRVTADGTVLALGLDSETVGTGANGGIDGATATGVDAKCLTDPGPIAIDIDHRG